MEIFPYTFLIGVFLMVSKSLISDVRETTVLVLEETEDSGLPVTLDNSD